MTKLELLLFQVWKEEAQTVITMKPQIVAQLFHH